MASIVELREKTDDQIEEMIEDAREELFNLRFQTATAQLEDYSRIRAVRRNLAQFQEVLHKRQLAAEAAMEQPEIAAALSGKEWSYNAHFDYEQTVWLVTFVDDNGKKLASASVNLNKKKPTSRRARKAKPAPQRVVTYEVAG